MHGPVNVKLERSCLWYSPKEPPLRSATSGTALHLRVGTLIKEFGNFMDFVCYIKSECTPQREHSLLTIEKSVSI